METKRFTKTIEYNAVKDYQMPELLPTISIDFSDDLNKTLKQVCYKVNIPEDQLKAILEPSPVIKTTELSKYSKWDIDFLIDYIIRNHHQYTKNSAVAIYVLAQKVTNSNGEKHPEFSKLNTQIFLFFHDLLNHIMKEESILFPSIKQLIKNRSFSGKGTYLSSGLIKDSIQLMQREHYVAGRYLRTLRKMTNNYKASADAGHSCRDLFEKMEKFELNLLVHMHLESNILFPKAIELDESMEQDTSS